MSYHSQHKIKMNGNKKHSITFLINSNTFSGYLGSVWYMCLKTENCCLKTFVEIRVGEKVYRNT